MRWLLAVSCVATGCSKPPHDAAMMTDGSAEAGAMPLPAGVGGHALAFDRFNSQHAMTITTAPFATSAAGSTMIVGVGRGQGSAFDLAGRAPLDNKGNAPYQLQGAEQHWSLYPQSSAGVYAFPSMAGGADTEVSAMVPPTDEITLAAVEVTSSSKVTAVWDEQRSPPLTSASVTTTGPATLVAFWWGDNDADPRTAVPDGGFVVIDSILTAGELVECAVAVKAVTAAGTYNVTWTSTPTQGAMLWLVAVE
jgi:hypothetical protein